MTTPLILIGAGGFGRETIDVVEAINSRGDEPQWHLVGVADDSPSEVNLARLAVREIAYLGSIADLAGENARFAVGIGSPSVRARIAQQLEERGLLPATLIHPDASVGSQVEIGAGSIVCAGARLTTNIRIGRHVHINPNATIGHDTELEDFVSLNPSVSISGDCLIGARTLAGVGSVVLNGLRVGSDVVIGGAACVVRDVPSGVIVKGVPAR